MRPIIPRSRKPMIVVVSIASMSCRASAGSSPGVLAAPRDVERPAHGGGRIGPHDLAYHHPIEQMAQRGQALLRGRRRSRAAQFLDVGRDMNARDVT